MKILSLEFSNKSSEWELELTHFTENLTLLVGISGVGKTQILQSILELKKIAKGSSLPGRKWKVRFSTEENCEYLWEGEFDTSSPEDDSMNASYKLDEEEFDNKPKIIYEKLFMKGEEIVSREKDNTIFLTKENSAYPHLPSTESLLYIMREAKDKDIFSAHNAFNKITYSDQSDSKDRMRMISSAQFDSLLKKYKSLDSIQRSDLNTYIKLFLTYQNTPELFEKIKERFINIFPQVEDIKFDWIDLFNDKCPVLKIKETGVKQWIEQYKISSGMFRAIMHTSEMYLLQEGTVVLIDEFENSLGVNCIDELTEDLIQEEKKLQFIVTSHHPYIINKIPVEYWKIVTRNCGVVKAIDSSKFHLQKSKHDAFMKLMQLNEYTSGIS